LRLARILDFGLQPLSPGAVDANQDRGASDGKETMPRKRASPPLAEGGRNAQCPLTAGRVLWIVHVDVVTGGDAVFAFSAAGASATARETDDGFVVLAGSTARRHGTGTFPAGYQASLSRSGAWSTVPHPSWFNEDVAFASPSAAAAIVAARSASGPREWRLRGSGQCYRDWRAERLGEG
jgi:hypothetical protein